jgi:hypothetical protein
MKFNLSTIIIVILAIIGLGVIAVATAGLVQWFFNNFWVIFLSGAVILGLVFWLKKSEKNDVANGQL